MINNLQENTSRMVSITLRAPTQKDAPALYKLIQSCKPLDLNSRYLYMLLCSHFRDTCAVGLSQKKMVCVVTGYIKPGAPDTLFIWQVAVSQECRKQGLAGKLINHLLRRSICNQVRYIEATVTPSNTASQKLFEKLAKEHKTEMIFSPLFQKDLFGKDTHEEEELLRIGPIKTQTGSKI